MVYIYKKVIAGKHYYYLRMSKLVKGKKITKDIAYLGSDISKVQDKLSKLPKEHALAIRKAYRNIHKFITSEYLREKIKAKKLKKVAFLSKERLETIESIKLHYQKYFLTNDVKTIQEVYKHHVIDFAYNTASLEGNTITLKEAARLLEENLTPKNRTLREVYDIQNTDKVFFELLEKKNSLTHKLIIEIHDKLMEKIDLRLGYRTTDIRVFKSRFKCSPGKYVKTDMDLLLRWYKKQKKLLHPFVLAAIFHQKFEAIHPFSDGNGRTGRMIMNYLLMQSGYPPIVIQKKNRIEYLNSLSKADGSAIPEFKETKYHSIIEFIESEMITSYWGTFLV